MTWHWFGSQHWVGSGDIHNSQCGKAGNRWAEGLRHEKHRRIAHLIPQNMSEKSENTELGDVIHQIAPESTLIMNLIPAKSADSP